MIKVDANVNQKNRGYFRYTNTHRRDVNVGGTSPGAAAPLETLETRQTFGGPLWNVLGNWTTTWSNKAFNELRVDLRHQQAVDSRQHRRRTRRLGPAGGRRLQHRRWAIRPASSRASAIRARTSAGRRSPASRAKATCSSSTISRSSPAATSSSSAASSRAQQMYMDVEAAHKGSFTFTQDRLFDTNDPSTYPTSFSGNIGSGAATPSVWNPSVYIQDTWQLGSNLTLNLGRALRPRQLTPTTVNTYVDAYNDADRVATRRRAAAAEVGGGQEQHLAAARRRLGADRGSQDDAARQLRLLLRPEPLEPHRHLSERDAARACGASLEREHPGEQPVLDAGEHGDWHRADARVSRQELPGLSGSQRAAVSRRDDSRRAAWLQDSVLEEHRGRHDARRSGRSAPASTTCTPGPTTPSIGPDTNWVQNANGTYARRDPRYGNITLVGNGGSIWYNGLETRRRVPARRPTAAPGCPIRCRRRASNTSTGLSTGGTTNPFDLNEDLGPDDNDRRHNFVLDGSYLVPKIDVQLAGITTYRSAVPYSVSTSFQLDADPFTDRPEPRNSRRGATEKSTDLRVSKIFRLRGRVHGDRVLGDVQRLQRRQLAALSGQPAVGAVRPAAHRGAEAAPAARVQVRFLRLRPAQILPLSRWFEERPMFKRIVLTTALAVVAVAGIAADVSRKVTRRGGRRPAEADRDSGRPSGRSGNRQRRRPTRSSWSKASGSRRSARTSRFRRAPRSSTCRG